MIWYGGIGVLLIIFEFVVLVWAMKVYGSVLSLPSWLMLPLMGLFLVSLALLKLSTEVS